MFIGMSMALNIPVINVKEQVCAEEDNAGNELLSSGKCRYWNNH